jgi:hypothetical protein
VGQKLNKEKRERGEGGEGQGREINAKIWMESKRGEYLKK